MVTRQTDPSSDDTRRAAGLYAQLLARPSAPPPPSASLAPAGGYVSLAPLSASLPPPVSTAHASPSQAPGARPAPSHPPEPDITMPEEPFGPGRWNAALDWCMSVTDGRSAFVLGAQGLVVAARGVLDAEAVELVGARVMVALDHVRRIHISQASLCALSLDFRDAVLTVMPVGEGDESVVLGIIGPHALTAGIRDAVASVLEGQVE